MNMNKIFNVKYFMQNLKKSKSIIIFIACILVLINAVAILAMNTSNYTDSLIGKGVFVPSLTVLSLVNIIAMYIVPIVLSCTLFSYVYKKNSVDYISSMPISRKTLFITNTIGGIVLIAIIMLLTVLTIGVVGLICSRVVLSVSMLVSYFFIWFATYSFVFVASNFAMSISGNMSTQLVVTALAIFLIPFMLHNIYCFSGTTELYSADNVYLQNNISERDVSFNYTVPYGVVANTMSNSNNIVQNNWQLYLATIVGIISYFILGLIMFKKRKMEVNETSFKSIHIHNIVKGLTMIPIVGIAVELLKESSFESVSVILIATAIVVYFYVYDLITRKKISHFRLSLIYLLAIVIVISSMQLAISSGAFRSRIHTDEIIAVSKEGEAFVQDKTAVDYLLNYADTTWLDEAGEDYYNETIYIKLKNNKIYTMDLKIKMDEYSIAMQRINSIFSTVVPEMNIDDDYLCITVDGVILTQLDNDIILSEIKQAVQNRTSASVEKEYSKISTICLYKYDTQLERIALPIEFSPSALQKYISICNNKFDMASYQLKFVYVDYFVESMNNNEFVSGNIDLLNGEFTTIIDNLQNDNIPLDLNRFAIITGYRNDRYCYFTSNLQELKQLKILQDEYNKKVYEYMEE